MLDLKQMNGPGSTKVWLGSNHRTLEFAKYLANKNEGVDPLRCCPGLV